MKWYIKWKIKEQKLCEVIIPYTSQDTTYAMGCFYEYTNMLWKYEFWRRKIRKHTYIHNWTLQLFSQDYDLVFTQLMLRELIFVYEWWNLQFKIDSKRQVIEKLFKAILHLLSEFLPDICWEEVAEEIFFHISFRGLTSYKPTHDLFTSDALKFAGRGNKRM